MKYLLTTIFAFISVSAYCCSCFIAHSFCSYDEPDTLESVFEIKIGDSVYSHSIYDYRDAIVTQHYFGPELQTEKITIRIDRNSSCEYFYGVGSSNIILKLAQFDSDSVARYPIYQFWLCLVNFASIEGDSVKGLFDGSEGFSYQNVGKMHKDDFLEWYPNCAVETEVEVIGNLMEEDIIISPNPSDGQFQIENLSHHNFEYYIYNDSGEIVSDGQSSSSSNNEILLKDLPAGIYFIRFFNENLNSIKKLLKI